jgi:hypothetical protein
MRDEVRDFFNCIHFDAKCKICGEIVFTERATQLEHLMLFHSLEERLEARKRFILASAPISRQASECTEP